MHVELLIIGNFNNKNIANVSYLRISWFYVSNLIERTRITLIMF